jgi:uncharacterized protein YjiS (DUF1127 family)
MSAPLRLTLVSLMTARMTLGRVPGLRDVTIWTARRRDRRALAALDPHLLRDIGLNEDQAAREAGKPFWRD